VIPALPLNAGEHAALKYLQQCLLLGMVTLLASCAWVKPTGAGAQVGHLTADQVGNCRKAGTTHVSVLDNIGVVKRGSARVEDELATLAANSAAQLGGNTVVPISEVEDGNQTFAVYQCEPDDLP
jgi:hypothetical protein